MARFRWIRRELEKSEVEIVLLHQRQAALRESCRIRTGLEFALES